VKGGFGESLVCGTADCAAELRAMQEKIIARCSCTFTFFAMAYDREIG
jgi:hypothetical protein